jgi:hypothetical protein
VSHLEQHTSAYVSIRQHTSASVSIRQHTSAYVSIHQHTSAYVSIRQHPSAYVSIRQHPSAYVSIRQHTSASVSIRQHTPPGAPGAASYTRFSAGVMSRKPESTSDMDPRTCIRQHPSASVSRRDRAPQALRTRTSDMHPHLRRTSGSSSSEAQDESRSLRGDATIRNGRAFCSPSVGTLTAACRRPCTRFREKPPRGIGLAAPAPLSPPVASPASPLSHPHVTTTRLSTDLLKAIHIHRRRNKRRARRRCRWRHPQALQVAPPEPRDSTETTHLPSAPTVTQRASRHPPATLYLLCPDATPLCPPCDDGSVCRMPTRPRLRLL